MKKFEYIDSVLREQINYERYHKTEISLTEYLNMLGQNGWDITPIPRENVTDYFAKREVE